MDNIYEQFKYNDSQILHITINMIIKHNNILFFKN